MRPVLALFFVLLLAGMAFSSLPARDIPYGQAGEGTLDAVVEPASAQPEARTGNADVLALVNLPSDSGPVTLMLAERTDGGWHVLNNVGTLTQSSTVKFSVAVAYDGKTSDVRHYALIGRTDDGTLMAKEFPLALDWSIYEVSMRKAITNANVLLVPLLSMGLIVLVIALFELAFVHRRRGTGTTGPGQGVGAASVEGAGGEEENSEGVVTSVFFPVARQTPASELIADIMLNPAFIVFELACIGLFAMLMLTYGIALLGEETGTRLFFITGIGSLFVPLMYTALAWLSDIYERKPLRFIIACFVWGGFAAVLAFLFNSLLALVLKAYSEDAAQSGVLAAAVVLGSAVVAPVIEETTKALGLLILSGHRRFAGIIDGLIYGFIIGVGFSFVENWFYFMGRASLFEPWLSGWSDFITYRLLFNSLAHGAFTAACGAFMGYFKSRPHLARYTTAAFLPGLLIAVALHSLFNVSAMLDEIAIYAVRIPVFVFNPLMVAVLAVALMLVFYLAMIEERKKVVWGIRQV
ncbi:Protease prsW family protein [Candidatus Burarchaeum australiense]|nr:Protease prsW family protein [Candidatus Burarchaeum australiense]